MVMDQTGLTGAGPLDKPFDLKSNTLDEVVRGVRKLYANSLGDIAPIGEVNLIMEVLDASSHIRRSLLLGVLDNNAQLENARVPERARYWSDVRKYLSGYFAEHQSSSTV